MLELLILLNSDILLYRDTFDMIHQYTWSLYRPISSMLSLGRILISNLVVANLLMYSLPGMILLYLAAPFLHRRCFCMSIIYQLAIAS